MPVRSLVVMSSLCYAAAFSTPTLASRMSTAAAHGTVLRLVQQPAMSMGGYGLDEFNQNRFGAPKVGSGMGDRNAEFRAQQRAQRHPSPRRNVQQVHSPKPHTTDFSFPMPSSTVPATAWVMIFNAGMSNEGVYTQTNEGARTSVPGFESEADALDFARALVSQGFDLATPLSWSTAQLAKFCKQGGYEASIVPRGTVPTTPATRQDDAADRTPEEHSYRLWLDQLMLLPDNCNNDDCTISSWHD